MSNTKAKIAELNQKVNALSSRERVILLVVAVVAMLGIYDYLALTPYLEQRKAHKAVVDEHFQAMAEVQTKVDAIIKRMEHDPNKLLLERIEKRKKYLVDLEKVIGEATQNLIDPKRMSQVLGYLLSRQSGMHVRSVKNMPAEPVSFRRSEEDEPEVLMYRHKMNLKLEGTYFQVTGYLKMIEGMKERLFWDDMTFKIEDYPRGVLELNVHTLSMSKELIGIYE
ncbi:MAG: hypothetical protein MI976_23740 [Pseudomonadales bacterium]|nr:hypothetical protein [Pseudomonadales bacterium]